MSKSVSARLVETPVTGELTVSASAAVVVESATHPAAATRATEEAGCPGRHMRALLPIVDKRIITCHDGFVIFGEPRFQRLLWRFAHRASQSGRRIELPLRVLDPTNPAWRQSGAAECGRHAINAVDVQLVGPWIGSFPNAASSPCVMVDSRSPRPARARNCSTSKSSNSAMTTASERRWQPSL